MKSALLAILLMSTSAAAPPVEDDWYTWACEVANNPIRFELFANSSKIGVGTQGGMGGDGLFPAEITREKYEIEFVDTKGQRFRLVFDKNPGEFIPFRLRIGSGSEASSWRCARSPR